METALVLFGAIGCITGIFLIVIGLNSNYEKEFAVALSLCFVSFLIFSNLVIEYNKQLENQQPKPVVMYGMQDKDGSFVTIDESTNGKPPVKVDDPRKAKWFPSKQERDDYMNQFYRLRGVTVTQKFEVDPN